MVNIKIPVIKRIIPPIFEIKLIFFLKFFENNKNFWIKYPDKTKGIAIPFVLSGYLIQKFLLFSKNFRKNINLISKIGGIILLITGILILTNQLQAIGFYIIEIFPFMQKFG